MLLFVAELDDDVKTKMTLLKKLELRRKKYTKKAKQQKAS